MFTHEKDSPFYIKSNKWRDELNRIICKPYAMDQERLFLVSFMRDVLLWDEIQVVRFLHEFVKWSNFNLEKTTRHVNLIFQRKEVKRIPTPESYYLRLSSETRHERNTHSKNCIVEKQKTKIDETSPSVTIEKKNLSCVFHVSSGTDRSKELNDGLLDQKQIGGNKMGQPPKEIKVYAQANTKDKWYKVSKKAGDFGNFYSIDSGPMVKVNMPDGTEQLGYGWAKNYIGVPDDTNILKTLLTGLQQVLDENNGNVVLPTDNSKETKPAETKKAK